MRVSKLEGKAKRFPNYELPPMKNYRFTTSVNLVNGERSVCQLEPSRLKGVFKYYEMNDCGPEIYFTVGYRFITADELSYMHSMSDSLNSLLAKDGVTDEESNVARRCC